MVFTRRPASLLWRFIICRALSRVPGISLDSLSRISMKFWANLNYQHITIFLHMSLPLTHLYPYSMLSPQPPQIQADLRSLGLFAAEQPQLASWPSLQPRDTECTTPALATAWAKAASLEAETETEVSYYEMENMERDINIRQHGMLSECGELEKSNFWLLTRRLNRKRII